MFHAGIKDSWVFTVIRGTLEQYRRVAVYHALMAAVDLLDAPLGVLALLVWLTPWRHAKLRVELAPHIPGCIVSTLAKLTDAGASPLVLSCYRWISFPDV